MFAKTHMIDSVQYFNVSGLYLIPSPLTIAESEVNVGHYKSCEPVSRCVQIKCAPSSSACCLM